MATKKQKRALALARREEFYRVLRVEGLEAQRRDVERRETKARQAKLDDQTKKRRDSVTEAVDKLLAESFAHLGHMAKQYEDSKSA